MYCAYHFVISSLSKIQDVVALLLKCKQYLRMSKFVARSWIILGWREYSIETVVCLSSRRFDRPKYEVGCIFISNPTHIW